MSYLPKYANNQSNYISFMSPESLAGTVNMLTGTGVPASATWPTANKAFYIPFVLRQPVLVSNLFVINGTTASGNLDIGIYAQDGTQITHTGSTAQSGTSAIQTVSITPVIIGPGVYYMALSMNGTTGTTFRLAPTSATMLSAFGIFQQTTSFPLPSSATFATASQTYIPLFGLITQPAV